MTSIFDLLTLKAPHLSTVIRATFMPFSSIILFFSYENLILNFECQNLKVDGGRHEIQGGGLRSHIKMEPTQIVFLWV